MKINASFSIGFVDLWWEKENTNGKETDNAAEGTSDVG